MNIVCPLCNTEFRMSPLDDSRRNPYLPHHPITPIDAASFRQNCKKLDECQLEQCPAAVAKLQQDKADVIERLQRDDPDRLGELKQAYEGHLRQRELWQSEVQERERQRRQAEEQLRLRRKKERTLAGSFAGDIARWRAHAGDLQGAATSKLRLHVKELLKRQERFCAALASRSRQDLDRLHASSICRHLSELQARQLRDGVEELRQRGHGIRTLYALLLRRAHDRLLAADLCLRAICARHQQDLKQARTFLLTALGRRQEQLRQQELALSRRAPGKFNNTKPQSMTRARNLTEWIETIIAGRSREK